MRPRPLQSTWASDYFDGLVGANGQDSDFDDLGAEPFPRDLSSSVVGPAVERDRSLHRILFGEDFTWSEGRSDLVELIALGLLDGVAGYHDFFLPQEWVQKFEPGSVMLSGGYLDPVLDAAAPHFAGRARLASNPELEVAFVASRAGAPGSIREVGAAKLLGPRGFLPRFLEMREYSGLTFSISESPGDLLLDAMIDQRRDEDGAPCSKPLLPIDEYLTLVVDLLRSCKVLESKGIVHGSLSEGHIFIAAGGAHAIITDFSAACLRGVHDDGDAQLGVGCRFGHSELVGSALRHAPEMRDGHPNDVSNNVWQLGLVFARMLLGGRCVTSHVVDESPGAELSDFTVEGRERIRDVVRRKFSLRDTPGYVKISKEYKDVLDIIESMLEKDPAERWTAAQALEEATKVAEQRRVTLPPLREPPDMLKEWSSAWQ